MILRICENGRERISPASRDLVEQAFAPDTAIPDGTEISVSEGDRWLVALAVGEPGGAGEFLLSGAAGETATVSGQAGRNDALRRFREFMAS